MGAHPGSLDYDTPHVHSEWVLGKDYDNSGRKGDGCLFKGDFLKTWLRSSPSFLKYVLLRGKNLGAGKTFAILSPPP